MMPFETIVTQELVALMRVVVDEAVETVNLTDIVALLEGKNFASTTCYRISNIP